jgi:threonine-phosphate decarboxylase
MLQRDDILNRLRRSAQVVIVDESFLAFTEETSLAPLVEEFPHLLVLRSLTKFEALPGLRIGALIGASSRLSHRANQREPWQVNVLAEAAALAALKDHEHAARTRRFVQEEREWLRKQLPSVGLPAAPSAANYLFCPTTDAAFWQSALCEEKILVRNCEGWPGLREAGLRIAVRTRAENERLLAAMAKVSAACSV